MDAVRVSCPVDKGQGVLLIDGARRGGVDSTRGKRPGVFSSSVCSFLRLEATLMVCGEIFEPLKGGENDTFLLGRSVFTCFARTTVAFNRCRVYVLVQVSWQYAQNPTISTYPLFILRYTERITADHCHRSMRFSRPIRR